jgi:hypothetical protein
MIIIFDPVRRLFLIRFEQWICFPHQVNRQFPGRLLPLGNALVVKGGSIHLRKYLLKQLDRMHNVQNNSHTRYSNKFKLCKYINK